MGLQVLSHDLLKNISFTERINKILSVVKEGDVVMLEGKLSSDEELTLISRALANVSGKFPGIEIAHLSSKSSLSGLEKLKHSLINVLAKERMGITVIGPSKLIKEIKMDPNKLEILFK